MKNNFVSFSNSRHPFTSCLVKIQPFVGETGVNSPGRRGPALLRLHAPLSTVPTKPKGIQAITFGTGLVATVARLSMLIANFPRGSTPFFFPSGFISIAFSVFGYDRKAAEILNQPFPSLALFTLLITVTNNKCIVK